MSFFKAFIVRKGKESENHLHGICRLGQIRKCGTHAFCRLKNITIIFLLFSVFVG